MVHKPRKSGALETLKECFALVAAPENRRLTIAWVVCFAVVIVIGLRTSTESASFLGIADSRESIVNFDFPVSVTQINVLQGQNVKKGDLLAQVDQPELELKIQEARAALSKLTAQQNLLNEMGHLGSLKRSRKKKVDSSTDPLATEITNMSQQIAVLENREKNLYVFAQINGVVGNVNFKKGETAAPYAPIMTISPTTPSYIDAFIHESLRAKVEIGQTVTIVSTTDTSKTIEGRIASMGSRIVELPLRIGRMQQVKMWGREILIEIPEHNPFLLGEKVEISHPFLSVSFPLARASEKEPKAKTLDAPTSPQEVIVPLAVKNQSAFEPSGAAYLKDLKKFVVASDDTDAAHSPLLFLFNRDGSVDNKLVKVEGLSDIHDIETVLQSDDGDLYLMSSQSPNKKGEMTRARGMLIRVKRNGMQFTAQSQVNLRPLIMAALATSKDAALAEIRAKESDLEIEAGYLENGHLNVGLKKPLLKDKSSVVLDLGPIAKIIDTQSIASGDFKLAHKITFPKTADKNTRVTDIAKIGNNLIITTVSKKPSTMGRLWSLNLMSNKIKQLEQYSDRSPEAVAFDSDNKELMILFDQKDAPAQYMRNTSIDFN